MDAASLLLWLLGFVVTIVVLYVTVRIGVRHGIEDVRRAEAAAAAPRSHLDADGL